MKKNKRYRMFLICPMEDHYVLANQLFRSSLSDEKLPLLPNIDFPSNEFDEIRYLPGGEFISSSLTGISEQNYEKAFSFCGVPMRRAAYFNVELMSFKRNAFIRILDENNKILTDLLFGERQGEIKDLDQIMRFFLNYPDRYEIIKNGKNYTSGYLYPSTDISLAVAVYDLHDGDIVKTSFNKEKYASFFVESGRLVLKA